MLSNGLSSNFLPNEMNFVSSKCNLSTNDSFSESNTFSKAFKNAEHEIVVIDSTEDESEHSMIKLKIKKNKTNKNTKKIKLSKKKKLQTVSILPKVIQPLVQINENSSNLNFDDSNVDQKHILPLVPQKNINVGSKFQATIPEFKLNSNKSWGIKDVLKNKIWDPKTIGDKEFVDCKKLMQMILDLNYLTDDLVCKFLVMHNYNVEETVNYCIMNREKLQSELIGTFVPEDPLFRKTRNSVYNKFLLKKL